MSYGRVLVLAGPTASGKTEVACEISKRLAVEAISFDSMQAYRGMPITTQAPTSAACGKLKTHLVCFLSPAEEYNAALFRQRALPLVSQIMGKRKTPLLVGGTGLYLRALLDGLFESESGGLSRNENLRAKLIREEQEKGGHYLHDELRRVDEGAAEKIHPNDRRRTVRALEVYRLTGRPMSDQILARQGLRGQCDCRIFFLDRERQDLYERINERVDQMIQGGLVEEVRALLGNELSVTARMALGIREIRAYLEGRVPLSEAAELLKKNTRHYAKRQIAWFRHEKNVEGIPVVAADTPVKIADRILDRF